MPWITFPYGGPRGALHPECITVLNAYYLIIRPVHCFVLSFLSLVFFKTYHVLDPNCWFLHDVTKIQTTKVSIEPIFYFHYVLEQVKSNFNTNFRFKRVLGFVIEYAWISQLLRDAAFTWRPRELSCRLKKWLIWGNFAI